jgi:hypothetical protein
MRVYQFLVCIVLQATFVIALYWSFEITLETQEKDRPYVVTGATGNIGSIVADRFLAPRTRLDIRVHVCNLL